MTSFFPDVNVWIALVYSAHQHHIPAVRWFDLLNGESAAFCRFTQLGLLRLLTQPGVMKEDLKTQAEAWRIYDVLRQDERVLFLSETQSDDLDFIFRKLTSSLHSSANQWPDAYLSAFAATENLTLVTFDRSLHKTVPGSLLL